MEKQEKKKIQYQKKDRTANAVPVFLAFQNDWRGQAKEVGIWTVYHALASFCMIILIEMLARHSVIKGVSFVWNHPFLVLYSTLLLTVVYTIPVLFPKRYFCYVLITVLLLALAITNFVLLFFRITPLAATDISLLTSVMSIMDIYLAKWQIVLVILLLIVAICAIFYVGIRMPKQTCRPIMGMVYLVLLLLTSVTITAVGDETGLLQTSFANLPDAYRENGFVYCFSRSLLGRGIDKPEEYSEETVDDILRNIKSTKTNVPEITPNIIFLQIESFIDLRRMKNVTYSEEPQPIFTALRDACQSGFLTVPSVGAGTANTEFEIISGMDLSYFGVGEYPYKTILQEKTCESMAYNLKENKYHSTAIHNNTGDFYDRNKVFANLGFDNFISEEYMNDVVTNEIGWAKDSILTAYIMDALKTSEKQDYIYTISVQDHGKYPTEPMENPHITIDGFAPDDEGRQHAFEYYVNQCHETDAFLGYLITELNQYDEPVVLVLYGDHLPNLEITQEELLIGDLFQTEYVIWSNRKMNQMQPLVHKSKNLYAFQLSAYIQELLGMNNGVLTKFHQKYMDLQDYEMDLETLQYDMLYGKQEMFGGRPGYETSDMQMGIHKIQIEQVENVGGSVYVKGEYFTPSSVVFCNDKKLDTQFLNENMLLVSDVELKDGDQITVAQTTEVYEKLSESSGFTFYRSE